MVQLRASPVTGRPLGNSQKGQQLRHAVDQMCIASGLPAANVRVINDSTLNSYAAWNRDMPEVVFTSQLVSHLTVRQLTGVAAHEVAHLRNRDSRIIWLATFGLGMIVVLATVTTAIALAAATSDDPNGYANDDDDYDKRNSAAGPAIAALSFVFVLWWVAFPLALLVRATISRRREYLADPSAVQYTRDPGALREALEILASSYVPPQPVSTTNILLRVRDLMALRALPTALPRR